MSLNINEYNNFYMEVSEDRIELQFNINNKAYAYNIAVDNFAGLIPETGLEENIPFILQGKLKECQYFKNGKLTDSTH